MVKMINSYRIKNIELNVLWDVSATLKKLMLLFFISCDLHHAARVDFCCVFSWATVACPGVVVAMANFPDCYVTVCVPGHVSLHVV
jgi:hypothetical protein